LSDQSGNISNVFLILLDFTLDGLNFSLNNLLLFLLDLLNSLLENLESRGKVLLLRGVGGDQSLLLINLLSPNSDLFLMLDLLVGELNGHGLVFSFFLFMHVFLLDNVGGLNTLLDVGDSFLLSVGCLSCRVLNLLCHLSDHGGRVSDSVGLFSFLGCLSFDDFLGG